MTNLKISGKLRELISFRELEKEFGGDSETEFAVCIDPASVQQNFILQSHSLVLQSSAT